MKITSPQDKLADIFTFDYVLELFEAELFKFADRNTYYYVQIIGETSLDIRDKIIKAYKIAGWPHVSCLVHGRCTFLTLSMLDI